MDFETIILVWSQLGVVEAACTRQFQNNKNYIVANKPKKTRKNNEQKHQLIYRQFK